MDASMILVGISQPVAFANDMFYVSGRKRW